MTGAWPTTARVDTGTALLAPGVETAGARAAAEWASCESASREQAGTDAMQAVIATPAARRLQPDAIVQVPMDE